MGLPRCLVQLFRDAPRKRTLLRSVALSAKGGDRQITSADGTSLSARSTGQGVPVVMVHGTAGRIGTLSLVEPMLAAEHGTDVQTIDLPGRVHIPAVLDTAITIRDRVCAHSGCDHKVAVGLGGRTTYHQLQRLCWPHHDQKTRDDIRKIRARRRSRAGPAP